MQVLLLKTAKTNNEKSRKWGWFTYFMVCSLARMVRRLEWVCKIKDSNLRLVSLLVDGLVGWWVGELMSWWVDGFVSWWICELVNLWVGEFVSWWVDELVSWWIDELVGLWIIQFVSLMCSGVIGLSWVDKPVSWFVLHFVYERSFYLGFTAQRQ